MTRSALIIGTGEGLSASLARLLAAEGFALTLVARTEAKLVPLAKETGAAARTADATDAEAIGKIVAEIPGRLDLAIYNPSARIRGPLTEIAVDDVRRAVDITAVGAFILGQAAAARMLGQEAKDGHKGTILFTGASAGVKGFPHSASFAMGKFAQRGLAQSMARELHPKGVHVAWINIDGGIANPGRGPNDDARMLDPDAIAQSYLQLHCQPRSAWSEELALRPWAETF